MEKPLGEWTMKEIGENCKNKYCDDCEFERNICPSKPCEWNFNEKESNIEDKVSELPTITDTNVSVKPAKPRLAEVLGVEVGERVRLPKFSDTVDCWVAADGWMHSNNGLVMLEYVFDAINHPESIIRVPRLTEAELERCRVYGAKWVSKDDYSEIADLWSKRPLYGNGEYTHSSGCVFIGRVFDKSLFPSVSSGECICVY